MADPGRERAFISRWLAGLSFAGGIVSMLSLLLTAHRKGVYLAVTERQLIAVQMRDRCNPVRVLFSVSVAKTRLTTREGTLLPLHTVWCESASGPISAGGKARAKVRLNIRARLASLDEVLTAVRLHGGAVDVPALPAVRIGP